MDKLAEFSNASSSATAVLPAPESETPEKLIFPKCIIVFSGTPGVGKTVLGEKLAQHSNLVLLDVDQTRKENFGQHDHPLEKEEEHKEMAESYDLNHQKAEEQLQAGHPVILSATYSWEPYHDQLKQLIDKIQVPAKIFLVSADDREIVHRLKHREVSAGSLSNIKTFDEYQVVRDRFKPIKNIKTVAINNDQPLDKTYQQVLNHLRDLVIKP